VSTEREDQQGSEIISSHIFKAWENSVVLPNTKEPGLLLQNTSLRTSRYLRVPKTKLKKTSPRKESTGVFLGWRS
jgi:hypothetical protein